ncbi:uncharacterized protein LOC124637210 [Helicoverpa zea]|uniref:uncharacterized protein LOC124637210 n=1 Tax=Helicoverpa zea TaxID=7113 RepID=UPI001F58DA84|nr:uncharacterized protein LOC124637210 [Helicoverpa zea]
MLGTDNDRNLFHLNRKVSHINTVSPDFLVGQIWLQEDEPTAVEIIELNTSDEFDPLPDEALDNRLDHAWSYTKKETLQQIQDTYKINQKARERRRQNHDQNFFTTNTSTNTNNQFTNKNIYSDVVGNRYIDDNQLINHQVNCFTIINKHFVNSDTSSDSDVEFVTSNDIIIDPTNWDAGKPYDEEIITYDPELDKETRTIWIYSFKNKHLLSENDYEFGNVTAKEMSSCSTSVSVDSDEEKTKDKSTSVRRLGSPIPPTYIPRLNLSLGPTLSTVTEVSEPNKQTSSNSSHKSPKNRFQKPRNSWISNESDKLDSARSVRKLEKSTNIVNWMALSPREKRRRSKEQGDIWQGSFLKLETLAAEELAKREQQQKQDSSVEENSIRLQVDVDVHVSVNEKSPEKRSLGTPNRTEVIVKTITDSITSTLTKSPEMDKPGALDRGDHDMKLEQSQKIMCGTSRICESVQLAGPAQAIPSQNQGPLTTFEEIKIDPVAFAREEREEMETASYDYLTDKLQLAVENADHLWMKKNAPFLKPSKWEDYKSIADSPLTIQMSITETEHGRQPWFKRFIKTINCCK